MANPELGVKRQCQNCGTKFFDFNRNPIVCPKCSTAFEAVAVRPSPRPAPAAEDPEVEVVQPDVETVSLEEVEADEKAGAAAEDELEAEDEAADDTFLEEDEEENDDVAGLIDGDIDPDEEG